jgi:fatty acid desaturase
MTGTTTATAPLEEINRVGTRRQIGWYRSPLDRDLHRALNRRSDLKGFAQTLGHLGLLAATGGLALYGAGRWPWIVVALLVFAYGTFHAFLLNGFHELCHNTVFKTKWLNRFFLRIFSFLTWHNYVGFLASHTKHHQYTLHQPDDLEVVLPQSMTKKAFFKSNFINPKAMVTKVRVEFNHVRGKFDSEWFRDVLFPESEPEKRRALAACSFTMLIGHGAILVVSVAMGWYLVPVIVSLAPAYGNWLMQLCNATQHIGLKDHVPDFRICCRTIRLNPFLQFLYWHMNFHTEHHMYAAVPCYNLGKLHRAIRHELPYCPNGLVDTWRRIAAIQKKQAEDPEYQFVPELPEPVPAAQ